jgi:hypothetical protein
MKDMNIGMNGALDQMEQERAVKTILEDEPEDSRKLERSV